MSSLLTRLLWIALNVAAIPGIEGFDCGRRFREKRCDYARHHAMLAADCFALGLTVVPHDLKAEIESLTLSHNRLRELTCLSFDPYLSLIHLYLDDNLITYIPEGVFNNLEHLEVVDLSHNALRALPNDFFQISILRKVYLDHNYFGEGAFDSWRNITGVVKLQFLSISFSELTEIPPLHNFLQLTHLNLSGNPLEMLSPLDLAPACNLTTLDLNHIEHLFQGKTCDCQIFETYLMEKNITLVPPYLLNCSQKASKDSTNCYNDPIPEDNARKSFESCKQHKTLLAEKAERDKNIIIGLYALYSSVGILLCGIVYFWKTKLASKTVQKNRFLNHAMVYRANDAEDGEVNLISGTESEPLIGVASAALPDGESDSVNDGIIDPSVASTSGIIKPSASADKKPSASDGMSDSE